MPNANPNAAPVRVNFAAGDIGEWRIRRMQVVAGKALASAPRLHVGAATDHATPTGAVWQLTGFTSNTRYTTADESVMLKARQEGLGRPHALYAALIPIRKNAAWWALAQDERRAIFEARSRHIAIGAAYLPQIARRLHHARDLGEPFDFLTWFEYAPEDEPAFDHMLEQLRASEEWSFVEREVDIRLAR